MANTSAPLDWEFVNESFAWMNEWLNEQLNEQHWRRMWYDMRRRRNGERRQNWPLSALQTIAWPTNQATKRPANQPTRTHLTTAINLAGSFDESLQRSFCGLLLVIIIWENRAFDSRPVIGQQHVIDEKQRSPVNEENVQNRRYIGKAIPAGEKVRHSVGNRDDGSDRAVGCFN